MTLRQLNTVITACESCPRLRAHCTHVAQVKRAAYKDQTYWGRPIPNLFAPSTREIRLLIVGLAPGAHGANRTSRLFTGDRSGDFLFQAMHATGFANQPTSIHASDGLQLIDCAITAACHCAPPDNKPTPQEIAACQPFLDQTARLLPRLEVMLALGRIAFDAAKSLATRLGWIFPKPTPPFAHGQAIPSNKNRLLLASYHPSQQNTFTGRLTQPMLQQVFTQARHHLLTSAVTSNND